MEKFYQDHAWNIAQAVMWYAHIGKHKRAQEYWAAHLKIADNINQQFKLLFR